MFTLRKEDTPVAFSAKADEPKSVITLDIMDVIGADFFGEGITAAMVKDSLAGYESPKSITVNINSPGGDLFEGVAIYNVLKASGVPVNINVIGMAASAASLVAMAGDKCTMQLGTQMMIHEGLAFCGGHADDMRKMADVLDSVTASAADIYVARTGMAKEKVLNLMKEETWMSPEEAKDMGFASAVSKDKSGVKNSFDLSVFKNTPASLKGQAEPEVVVPPVEVRPEVPDANEGWEVSLRLKQIEVEKRK